MKTATIKTLGAAALGVAFAAAAAGTASAAPAPQAGAPALDSFTSQLPADHVSGLVPGAAQAGEAFNGALHGAPTSLGGATGGGLLGGLPTHGLPVSGFSGGLPVSG